MSNTNGSVLWKNETISFVATGLDNATSNEKTGDMIQTWIIRNDIHPVEAIKQGKDDAICGDCVFRGDGKGKKRGCYVTTVFAPSNIYKSLDNYSGKKSKINDSVLRLGAYGDPAFVPYSVIDSVTKRSKKNTGYTHQWRKSFAQDHKQYCMASVETLEGKEEANKMGWRTFRVTSDLNTKTDDEIFCPASAEMGKKLTCADCGICNGNRTGRKKNVVIMAHGSPVSSGRFSKEIAE